MSGNDTIPKQSKSQINKAVFYTSALLIFLLGVVSENGIYGHSRFCNTDFDDKLACLNLSGV